MLGQPLMVPAVALARMSQDSVRSTTTPAPWERAAKLLISEVEYRELTGGEHRLRHPAWKGFRNTPPATIRIPPVE
jgi:hypothetical protein